MAVWRLWMDAMGAVDLTATPEFAGADLPKVSIGVRGLQLGFRLRNLTNYALKSDT